MLEISRNAFLGEKNACGRWLGRNRAFFPKGTCQQIQGRIRLRDSSPMDQDFGAFSRGGQSPGGILSRGGFPSGEVPPWGDFSKDFLRVGSLGFKMILCCFAWKTKRCLIK